MMLYYGVEAGRMSLSGLLRSVIVVLSMSGMYFLRSLSVSAIVLNSYCPVPSAHIVNVMICSVPHRFIVDISSCGASLFANSSFLVSIALKSSALKIFMFDLIHSASLSNTFFFSFGSNLFSASLYAVYSVLSVTIFLDKSFVVIFAASSFFSSPCIFVISTAEPSHHQLATAHATAGALADPMVFITLLVVEVDDGASVSVFFLSFHNISSKLLGLSFALISEAFASATLASVEAHTVVRHHPGLGIGIKGTDHNILLAVSFNFQSPTGVHLNTVSITVMRRSQTIATPKRLISIHPKISLCHPVILTPNALC